MQDLRAVAQVLFVIFLFKGAVVRLAATGERNGLAVVAADVGGVGGEQARQQGQFGVFADFAALGQGAHAVNGEKEGGKRPGLGLDVVVGHAGGWLLREGRIV